MAITVKRGRTVGVTKSETVAVTAPSPRVVEVERQKTVAVAGEGLTGPAGPASEVDYSAVVPYVGATTDINIGSKAIIAEQTIAAPTNLSATQFGPAYGSTWDGAYDFTVYYAIPLGGGNFEIGAGTALPTMTALAASQIGVVFVATAWPVAEATHLYVKQLIGGVSTYALYEVIHNFDPEEPESESWGTDVVLHPIADTDATLGGTISEGGTYAKFAKDGYAVDSNLPIRASNFSGSSSGTNTGDQDLSLYAKTNRGVTVGYSGGNVSTLTYSDGSTKTLSYNGSGQLSSIVYGGTGPHFTKTFSYNGDGALSGVTIS